MILSNDLIALPLPQRLQAMELLWSSLTLDADQPHIAPDWHKKIVIARAKELRSGATAVRSLEDAKLHIQKRIQQAKR